MCVCDRHVNIQEIMYEQICERFFCIIVLWLYSRKRESFWMSFCASSLLEMTAHNKRSTNLCYVL